MRNLSAAFLPTNEYLGILWTLAGIKDAAIINHGTAGCNFYEFVTAAKETKELIYDRFCSTGIEQEEIALDGGEEKLKAVIEEVAKKDGVRLIVIVANPVSSLIGVDVEAVATEMAPHIEQPILTFNHKAFKEEAEKGIEEAMAELIHFYCPPSAKKNAQNPQEPLKVNILGPAADTFQWKSDEKELRRLLALAGMTVNAVFPNETTTEEIKALVQADITIVTRSGALKAAQYLEEQFGIPYLYGLPYGQKGTFQWLQKLAALTKRETPLKAAQTLENFPFHHYLEMISAGEFYQRDWKTVISCPPAMANGVVQMVSEEWSLPVVALRFTAPPQEKELEEIDRFGIKHVLVTPDELEWKAVLDEVQPFIVMGSAEDTALAKAAPIQLRITSPAHDTFSFYEGNPYIGSEGFKNLSQQLLNQISLYRALKES